MMIVIVIIAILQKGETVRAVQAGNDRCQLAEVKSNRPTKPGVTSAEFAAPTPAE
jgi:hypothetical protein